MSVMKKIALITSGGDSPGMNACIRSIVKTCLYYNIIPFGIHDGFQGMIDKRGVELGYSDVDNIIYRGGTILGTARCEEFRTAEGRQKAINFLKEESVDGLVVIGGDGSFTGAYTLGKEMSIPIIGIPGTIDNDIFGTDHTIGFDTALNTVVDAIDKIRDTASSHHRAFFIEVMGRDAGFIALNAAIASGAESVLIPEELTNIDKLVEEIKTQNKGRRSSIIIVAEGDDGGGAKEILEKVKPFLPNYDLRFSVLGHIQRGGSPSALDRIIATRMGSYSVELLIEGKSNCMIGVYGETLSTCSIESGIKEHAVPEQSKIDILKKLRTQ
jgi:6-phosphofructokinase 1